MAREHPMWLPDTYRRWHGRSIEIVGDDPLPSRCDGMPHPSVSTPSPPAPTCAIVSHDRSGEQGHRPRRAGRWGWSPSSWCGTPERTVAVYGRARVERCTASVARAAARSATRLACATACTAGPSGASPDHDRGRRTICGCSTTGTTSTSHPVMGQVERGYAGGSIFCADGRLARRPVPRRARTRGCSRRAGSTRVAVNNVNVHATRGAAAHRPTSASVAATRRRVAAATGIRVHLSVSFAAPIVARRAADGRPARRPTCGAWWARGGRAGLRDDPRLRRLRRQGRLRGPARPVRVRARPRRRREHARRGARTARRRRALAGVRLQPPPGLARPVDRPGPRRVRPLRPARRAVRRQRRPAGQARPDGLPDARTGLAGHRRDAAHPGRGRAAGHAGVHRASSGTCATSRRMWSEVLGFRPWGGDGRRSPRSPLARPGRRTAAGSWPSRTSGDDPFWTGHPLAQANLYAFGRLAWDPTLDPADDPRRVDRPDLRAERPPIGGAAAALHAMLDDSWRTYESYTAPLGVGFMVRPGHHYGPDVDGYEYTPWGTYHFADRDGIGVDRTRATGTGFAGQYPQPWSRRLRVARDACPDELLLFFHHVPYDARAAQRVDRHPAHLRHALRRRRGGGAAWSRCGRRSTGAVPPGTLRPRARAPRRAVALRPRVARPDPHGFFRRSGIPDETGRTIY